MKFLVLILIYLNLFNVLYAFYIYNFNILKNKKLKLTICSNSYLDSINKNYTSKNEKIKFNTLFFNIYKFKDVYIEKNFTKIILNTKNNNKMYYVNEKQELKLVNSSSELIPNKISKIIIADLNNCENNIDNLLGFIYDDKNL
jgi:hypothetical protein